MYSLAGIKRSQFRQFRIVLWHNVEKSCRALEKELARCSLEIYRSLCIPNRIDGVEIDCWATLGEAGIRSFAYKFEIHLERIPSWLNATRMQIRVLVARKTFSFDWPRHQRSLLVAFDHNWIRQLSEYASRERKHVLGMGFAWACYFSFKLIKCWCKRCPTSAAANSKTAFRRTWKKCTIFEIFDLELAVCWAFETCNSTKVIP